MAGDGDATLFRGVLELAVASLESHQAPPVLFNQADHVPDLHALTSLPPATGIRESEDSQSPFENAPFHAGRVYVDARHNGIWFAALGFHRRTHPLNRTFYRKRMSTLTIKHMPLQWAHVLHRKFEAPSVCFIVNQALPVCASS